MPQAKNNPLIELLITIVIPSVILMKFSAPEALGSVNALPATLIMAAVLYYLSRTIHQLAGLKLAEAFKQS